MRATTFKDYTERMLRVLVYIQQHLDGELGLEQLAAVAAFSPSHFHRIFRGMVGESVQGHVRRLRLERAAGQLKTTAASVTEIALNAGYETPEAFSRAFREMFNRSPTQLRTGHGLVQQPVPSGVAYRSDGVVASFLPLDTGGKEMQVEILQVDPIRVAFVRHVGPYDQCGTAWQRLCQWAGPQGLLGGGARMLGLCHDDPEITPPELVRYDACLSVDESIGPDGEIGIQTITGGTYAMTTHLGPYHRLGETYALLMGQWIPRHGYQVRGAPSFEVYLNDPEGTEPEDLVTDVYVPLAGEQDEA